MSSDPLRLDKNECPYPFPEDFKETLFRIIADIEPNRYPDPSYGELRHFLGEYVHFDGDNIIPGNGGDEILWMVFAKFISRGDKVLTLNPAFSQYEHMCDLFGALRITIPIKLDNSFSVDEDSFLDAIDRQKPNLILLDSPNNPTGISLSNDFIDRVVDMAKCPVLIDEAYGEFADYTYLESKNIDTLPRSVVVLKTLSKAWGIAGLRVGYAVAERSMADRLNRARSPFNLNVYSQTIAIEMLKKPSLVKSRINSTRQARERLYRFIKDLKGWKVFPGNGNFLLTKSPDNIVNVLGALQSEGIHVKKFSLPWEGDWIRITIGNDNEINRLIDVMGKI